MYKKLALVFLAALFIAHSWAQSTQNIKGTVIDRQAETPLVGATVMLLGSNPPIGAYSDDKGAFVLRNVPVGRQEIQISYTGYAPVTLPNILVTAGKEVIVEIKLEESILQAAEVVITGTLSKDKAQNELATVSARTFSLEEVTRFSGSRNDAARMAANFAGVSAPNDSRNDIVIRGNAPTGVLWRMEGLPIPNPNHFSTLGTTGGPVSALNTNLLKDSDFLTGAFPAEYGNANAGVFDVSLRNGNKDKYEFTGQIGFTGAELMAEGPINSAKTASFVASYRYSFVGLLSDVLPIGTTAAPRYQDFTFKVDFGYGKLGSLSLFGLGAKSDIDFLGTETDEDDLFANPSVDAFPSSQMGLIGLKHNVLLGKDAYLRTVIGFSTEQNEYIQDNYLDNGQKFRSVENEDITNRLTVLSYFNKKFNARLSMRAGLQAESYSLESKLLDRDNRPDEDGDGLPDWFVVRDFNDNLGLFQAYVTTQYKLNEKITLNTGLHGQYLGYNEASAIEPRAAINWNFLPKHTLSVGLGFHSQMQPLPIYFYQEQIEPGIYARTNENLDFTRSRHYVLSYDYRPGSNWRVKAETYYQSIIDAPVENVPSSFSVLNAGADFVFPDRGSLVNEGIGRNYGVELTVEKFFSKGFYGLFTTTLYDSEYEGSDKIRRNTAFNNQYIVNFLAGKEWKAGKKLAFTLDTKLTTSGGRCYTPVDLAATRANNGREVLDEINAFSEQFDPYFRWDLKLGFRLNSLTRRLSQQFFVDLQNFTGAENIFVRRYNEVTDQVNDVNQIGFFPDIMWRIQF